MSPKTAAIIARKSALQSSSATYIGQACDSGHVLRYTANRLCVECAKARRAAQTENARQIRVSASLHNQQIVEFSHA